MSWNEELLKSQSRYQELEKDFTALQAEHAKLQTLCKNSKP